MKSDRISHKLNEELRSREKKKVISEDRANADDVPVKDRRLVSSAPGANPSQTS